MVTLASDSWRITDQRKVEPNLLSSVWNVVIEKHRNWGVMFSGFLWELKTPRNFKSVVLMSHGNNTGIPDTKRIKHEVLPHVYFPPKSLSHRSFKGIIRNCFFVPNGFVGIFLIRPKSSKNPTLFLSSKVLLGIPLRIELLRRSGFILGMARPCPTKPCPPQSH